MPPVTETTTPSTPSSVPAVYRSIACVIGDLSREGISKDRKNEAQRYSFRGIEDVYQALSPLLVKHGLVIVPKVVQRIETTRESMKGGAIYSVAVHVSFRLIAVADGSEVEAMIWGEAMDSADKATNKAISAAYKYMAFTTFCIPVEGTEDADSETPQVKPSRPAARPPSAPAQPPAQAPAAAPVKAYYEVLEVALQDIEDAKSVQRLHEIGVRVANSPLTTFEKSTARDAYERRREAIAGK